MKILDISSITEILYLQIKRSEKGTRNEDTSSLKQICTVEKTRWIYDFISNLQSKLKKFRTLFLGHLPRRTH